VYRWLVIACGSGFLVQTAVGCDPTDPLVQEQLRLQILLPWLASVFADALFFLLDNALVHLTS
jgi:hypothetical protein